MALDETLSPALPEDLERVIFEMAAFFWPRLIPKFMLVALRVKIWVEPLLYRTLIVGFGSGQLLPIKPGALGSLIHSKPSAFFRDSTRNLFVNLDLADDGDIVLSAFSGIRNLWLHIQTSAKILELDMRLQRLHCRMNDIFKSSKICLMRPFFSSITHLEIFDAKDELGERFWPALIGLPNLTHLALNGEDYLPTCRDFLPTWPSLRVLIILLLDDPDTNMLRRHGVPELAEEPRFVVIVCGNYIQDWMDGARMGRDFWSFAHDVIAQRKSGETDPLEYYVSPENK
ncbi:hypothetical protein C8R45DRAFT_86943 [Mycena sanguinolenta]|nr:hypothetical protein C8R45DRAFT_86943 [Mycena sanguinolenta]